MATRMVVRVSLFCVFAMSSALAAQQPADNHAEARGGAARAAANGVGTPQCIRCPPPSYSKKAQAAKYQGTVVLDVTVTADGKIIDSNAIKNPGLGLTEKALTQVKKWKMKPALGPDGKTCRLPGANRSHVPLVL